jgi:prevent-host-death family protein
MRDMKELHMTMVMPIVICGRQDGVAEKQMQTIKASEFKAKCLALMDQVALTGERIVITKNGKPVAELIPHQAARPASPFGMHKDIKILGDIMSPIDVEWDAMK